MQKERLQSRRQQKRDSLPVKINYRLVFGIIIAIVLLIIKIMPGSVIKEKIAGVSETTTDYPEMISEVMEVFNRHTFGNSRFIMPVEGVITSPFGQRTDPIDGSVSEHFGIDINAALDTEVKASYDGTVTRAETNEYYGNFIMIDHGEGISTLYGHLNEIKTQTGAVVKSGDTIGLSGNSGRSTGPHLHFEVRKDNKPQNPSDYLIK